MMKIGDKIVVTSIGMVGEISFYKVGDVGIIDSIDGDGDLWVNLNDMGNPGRTFGGGVWCLSNRPGIGGTCESVAPFLSARGITFKMFDDDPNSETLGETLTLFLAQAELNKGYTIKDLGNDDPEAFVWCVNLAFADGTTTTNADSVKDVKCLLDLIRVKGAFFSWSDFVKAAGPRWSDCGPGYCAF